MSVLHFPDEQQVQLFLYDNGFTRIHPRIESVFRRPIGNGRYEYAEVSLMEPTKCTLNADL